MGQFFRSLLASCLGVFLALILLFGLGAIVIAGIASQAEQPKKIKPNSVLHLTFSNQVPEHTNNVPLSPFDIKNEKVLGLRDVLATLAQARDDDHIKGIFLEADNLNVGGIVMTSALREGIREFRKSGKFVIAYSKYYSQGSYYLASAADKVFLNPMGMVDFRGFGALVPFFKNMLDKVGVDVQVFYAGKFKSATEPFRLSRMSDENRFQTRAFLESTYRDFLADISEDRGISVEDLRTAADVFAGGSAESAHSVGLIDEVGYREQALDALRERLGLEKDEKIPVVGLNAYHRSNPPLKDYTERNKIAVVYAEGSIVDGDGENGVIGDTKYTRIIRDLRKDDDVKAIVLRVNSPGGSAMASENIWHELSLAREEGKPVVVSMGDYAASGGYYISMASDSIFAEAKTLTGSIGVFLMIPNAQELLNDKLGINVDTVKTNPLATELTPFHKLSPQATQFMRKHTDRIYETFLARVAENRNMSRDDVHEIAQGRVWTGKMAQEIGLVDRLGGMDEAVRSAASLAGVSQYRLSEYPRIKDPLQELIQELVGMDDDALQSAGKAVLGDQLGEWKPYLEYAQELKEAKGPQARLPLLIPFN